MRTLPNYITVVFLLLGTLLFLLPFAVSAQSADRIQTLTEARNSQTSAPQGYVPLVRIPGITDADFANATTIVNGLVRIVIVAAGLLAVIQIVRGGFLYITTEAVSTKGEAKKLISDALTGLLLILGSVLILTLINPDILKLRLFNDPRPKLETRGYQSNTFLTPSDSPNLPDTYSVPANSAVGCPATQNVGGVAYTNPVSSPGKDAGLVNCTYSRPAGVTSTGAQQTTGPNGVITEVVAQGKKCDDVRNINGVNYIGRGSAGPTSGTRTCTYTPARR